MADALLLFSSSNERFCIKVKRSINCDGARWGGYYPAWRSHSMTDARHFPRNMTVRFTRPVTCTQSAVHHHKMADLWSSEQ
jgi:hypothetical protein